MISDQLTRDLELVASRRIGKLRGARREAALRELRITTMSEALDLGCPMMLAQLGSSELDARMRALVDALDLVCGARLPGQPGLSQPA